jgi:hypothetical protein
MKKLETEILECLARGYTYVANEQKKLDVELINAMAEELMKLFDKELPETVILAFENFPMDKSTVTDLLDALLNVKKRR